VYALLAFTSDIES